MTQTPSFKRSPPHCEFNYKLPLPIRVRVCLFFLFFFCSLTHTSPARSVCTCTTCQLNRTEPNHPSRSFIHSFYRSDLTYNPQRSNHHDARLTLVPCLFVYGVSIGHEGFRFDCMLCVGRKMTWRRKRSVCAHDARVRMTPEIGEGEEQVRC